MPDLSNVQGWDGTQWVKILVNAAGKLIIDPSEILEDTPTDGEIGKAPTSNWAHDHEASLHANTQGAKVHNSVNISIPNNILTALTFDEEEYDTDNIHSLVTNPDRLTCKTAGKYLVYATIYWSADATGVREVGFATGGVAVGLGYNSCNAPPAGVKRSQSCAIILDLAIDEWVECVVWQTSGGALNIETNNFSPKFAMQRIG